MVRHAKRRALQSDGSFIGCKFVEVSPERGDKLREIVEAVEFFHALGNQWQQDGGSEDAGLRMFALFVCLAMRRGIRSQEKLGVSRLDYRS